MVLRILTWNLMHGRSVPGQRRDLLSAFAEALGGWEWDVALLQEVPPWWAQPLADATGSEQRSVLTSRNSLLALRRAAAVRWPDLIKSNGGGANLILVRGLGGVVEHRVRRLAWWPERRWVHAVRLGNGVWVGNLHTGSYAAQGRLAAETAAGWAEGSDVVLGGDFNVAPLVLEGFELAGGHGVDQVFVGGGLTAGGPHAVLDRGPLSDHAPVLASVMKKTRIPCQNDHAGS